MNNVLVEQRVRPPPVRRPAGRSGTDLVKDAVDEVMQRIDEDCMPRSLPKLTAEQVDERLNQIDPAALSPDAALHVLLELRYYQLQRLVPDDRAFSLFDAILGPGQGRAFVDGNEAKRRTLLATWLRAKPG